MALHADNTLISNREMIAELVLTPLRATAAMLENLAMNNSRTRALRAIAEIPEEELRVKGISRAEIARMTFHHDA